MPFNVKKPSILVVVPNERLSMNTSAKAIGSPVCLSNTLPLIMD